jgi:hypothetical protein
VSYVGIGLDPWARQPRLSPLLVAERANVRDGE